MHDNTTRLEPLAVDIPEACRLTGLGRSKLYELLTAGEIPSVKVGKRRVVPVASLRQWLAKLSNPPAQGAA
jgi:excisionase family DNA binding protein